MLNRVIKVSNSSKIKIKYLNEKGRFLLFAFSLFLILFLAYFLFKTAYARYEMEARLVTNIDKALYIFEAGEVSFNLEPKGIIPRNDAYTYRFSVSNFNSSHDSDVDLTYRIRLRTTTNLPLSMQLYRNELPTDNGAVNILGVGQNVQDEDGAWYHVFDINTDYEMLYVNETTDYYTLVITLPVSAGADTTYANAIENIEITLKSRQEI